MKSGQAHRFGLKIHSTIQGTIQRGCEPGSTEVKGGITRYYICNQSDSLKKKLM